MSSRSRCGKLCSIFSTLSREHEHCARTGAGGIRARRVHETGDRATVRSIAPGRSARYPRPSPPTSGLRPRHRLLRVATEATAPAEHRPDEDPLAARAQGDSARTAAASHRRASDGVAPPFSPRGIPRRPRAARASGSARSGENIRAPPPPGPCLRARPDLDNGSCPRLGRWSWRDGRGRAIAPGLSSPAAMAAATRSASKRAQARTLPGAVKSTTSMLTGPSVCVCRMNRPSNLSAEPSMTVEHDRLAQQFRDRLRIVVAASGSCRPRARAAPCGRADRAPDTSKGRMVSSRWFAPARESGMSN